MTRYLLFLLQYNLKRYGIPFTIEDNDQAILTYEGLTLHLWDGGGGFARYREDSTCDLVYTCSHLSLDDLWTQLEMSGTCEIPDMLEPDVEDRLNL